jgi:predicted outer membrane repeat protein
VAFILPLFFLFSNISYSVVSYNGITTTLSDTLYQNSSDGALNIQGSNITWSAANVTFNNNRRTGTGTANYGGAINLGAGTSKLTFNNVVFTNNRAGKGGAIYLNGSSVLADFTANTVSIQSNSATEGGAGGGGGISLWQGAKLTMNITSMSINGNYAASDGGGLYVQGNSAALTINVSSYLYAIGNLGGNGVVAYMGAGASNGSLIVNLADDARFIVADNVAGYSGMGWGAFMHTNSSNHIFAVNGGTLTVRNNLAQGQGYASFVSFGFGGSNNLVKFSGVSGKNMHIYLTGNSATSEGGVIRGDGSGSNNRLEFAYTNMYVNSNAAPLGGVIYLLNGTNIKISDSVLEFTDNKSTSLTSQGVIGLSGSATMELSNIIRMVGIRNIAGNGGFLYLPNITFVFQGPLMQMTSNTAFGSAGSGYGRGGAFYFTSSDVDFSGSTIMFNWNTALGAGGAMYISNKRTAGGGARYGAASMTFTGNTALGGHGGAIFFENSAVGNFAVSGSITFQGNRAMGGNSGGAMYFGSGTSATFSAAYQMRFNNNLADGNGGAMYFDGAWAYFPAGAASAIQSIEFSGNTSRDGSGGAMYFANMRTTISFSPDTMTFGANTAKGDGGAMSFTRTSVSVETSSIIFRNNVSTGGRGGAMYFGDGASVTFRSAYQMRFNNNIADSNGGAMFFSDAWAYFPAGAAGQSIEFSGNISRNGSGGAMYFTNMRTTVAFSPDTMTFASNVSKLDGGAMAFSNARILIQTTSIEFRNNVSTSGRGGGMYFIGGTSVTFASKYSMRFKYNTAYSSGGGMYFSAPDGTYFKNIRVLEYIGNISSYGTGGGMAFGDIKNDLRFTPVSMTFSGNRARLGGGGMNFRGTTVTFAPDNASEVSSMSFTNNTSWYGSGGGMNFENSSATFNMTGEMIFRGNLAYSSGGAMYFKNTKAQFGRARLMVFEGNVSKMGHGGAMGFDDISVEITFLPTTLSFIRNTANDANGLGGAMYFSRVRASFSPVSMTFTGNSASLHGGGMYFSGSTVIFSGGSGVSSSMSFSSNIAQGGSGGGMYFDRGSSVTFAMGSRMLFEWNRADRLGGVIYFDGVSSVNFLEARLMDFRGNRAGQSGGGMYFVRAGEVNFHIGTINFTSNVATSGNGGAIYFDRARANFSPASMTFSKNIANVDGGGMYFSGSTVIFASLGGVSSSMSFSSNVARSGSGGGMYFEAGSSVTFAMGGMVFEWNTASSSGGVIYFDRVSRVSFDGASLMDFMGNSATNFGGGGMYFIDAGSVLFRIGTMNFINNKALGAVRGSGGGMYFEGVKWVEFSPATMTFRGNYAGMSGGAMYFSRSSVGFMNMDSMTFNGNTAERGAGGAMYFSGTTVVFAAKLSMRFEDNSAYDKGGAMYLERGSYGEFRSEQGSLTFKSNKLTAPGMSSGSGIYVDHSTLIFGATYMDFDEIIGDYGSVLYGTNDSYIRFERGDIDITSNTTNRGFGVITWDNGTVVEFRDLGKMRANWNYAESGGFLRISRAGFIVGAREIEITSNTAKSDGGAIYLDYAKLEFGSPIIPFRYNTAGSNGGAIYLIGSSIAFSGTSTNPARIEFTGNSAKYGGALYAQDYSSVVFEYADVYINGNESSVGGGVVSWEGNTYVAFRNLGELEAKGNKASWGGFLSITGAKFELGARRIEISSNIATGLGSDGRRGNGGGIYLNDAVITFANVSLIGNTADSDGGGIYAVNGSSLTFTAFIGGGLPVIVRGNEANRGGGLYIGGKSRAEMNAIGNDIIFGGNTARTGKGHDIYIEDSELIFNSDVGRRVEIGSGIWADVDSIIDVVGGGDLELSIGGQGHFEHISSFGVIGGGRLIVEHAFWEYINNQSSVYVGGSTVIFNYSTVTFSGNSSVINGGAIYADNGSVVIIDKSYMDLTGNNSEGSGGAIYVGGWSTVTFIDSRIRTIENVAKSSGGFLYIGAGELRFKEMESLYFEANTALWGGGVFYLDGRDSILDISGVKSLRGIGNASKDGGFAYLSGQRFDFIGVERVEMASNSADASVGGLIRRQGSGGVFYLDSSTLTFSDIGDMVFNYNYATSSGGVIYMGNSSLVEFSSFSVLNFIGNRTERGGGGVFYVDGTSRLSLRDIGKIEGHLNVGGEGGFAYFNSQEFSFSRIGIIMTSNSAVSGSGGVFYLNHSTVTFDDVEIELSYNIAQSSGGAIYIGGGSSVLFKDMQELSFHNNTSEVGGGGVFYAHEGSDLVFDNIWRLHGYENWAGEGGFAYFATQRFYFKDMQIVLTSNSANVGGGGAVYLKKSEVTFDGVFPWLEYNYAATSGGAVYVGGGSTLAFMGGEVYFTHNSAGLDGGVFYISSDSILEFKGVKTLTAVDNEANRGGFAYFVKREMEFNDMSILMERNIAYNSMGKYGAGGAFAFGGGTVSFNRSEAQFTLNTSEGDGGVIYGFDGLLRFTDSGSSFINNESGISGGAIYIDGRSSVYFTTGIASGYMSNTANFLGNRAQSSGGAVYMGGNSNFVMERGHIGIEGNIASVGGAFYIDGKSAARFRVIEEMRIIGNRAIGDGIGAGGGGIYVSEGGSLLSLSDIGLLEFRGNISSVSGGGLYSSGTASHIIIDRARRLEGTGNIALSSGGFAYIYGQGLDFSNSDVYLVANTAGASGGAIYIEGGGISFNNRESYISSNSAGMNGGGIGGIGALIEVYSWDLRISANSASNSGGGIYLDGGTIKMREEGLPFIAESILTIDKNIARADGGGIYSNGGLVELAAGRVEIIGNTALERGGGIYIDKGTAVFRNEAIKFIANSAKKGGALYLEGGVIRFGEIDLVEISSNISRDGDGVIGYGAVGGVIDFNGARKVLAIGNTANSGGFIAIRDNQQKDRIEIRNIEAIGNIARAGNIDAGDGGGVIYVDNEDFAFNIGTLETGASGNEGDILFRSNTAYGNGGAIYVDAGTVSVNARAVDAIFELNKGNKVESNDIYIGGSGLFIANAKDGNIYLHSGIKGGGKIVKGGISDIEGKGNLYIGGFIKHQGDMVIEEGAVIAEGWNLVSGIRKANTIELFNVLIKKNGKLGFDSRGKAENMTTANINGHLEIEGGLGISINIAKGKGDLIKMGAVGDGRVIISSGSGSSLSLDIYGGIGEFGGTIAQGQGVEGYFSNYLLAESFSKSDIESAAAVGGIGAVGSNFKQSEEVSVMGLYRYVSSLKYYDNKIELNIKSRSNFGDYIGALSYNQSEAARMFDSLESSAGIEDLSEAISILGRLENNGDKEFNQMKAVLDKISGSFIGRVIMSGAYIGRQERIYKQMKEIDAIDGQRRAKRIWGQIENMGNWQEGEDMIERNESEGYGGAFGIDMFKGRESLGGIYIGYSGIGIKEGRDEATVSDIELGIYGGWFRGLNSEIKGNISLGIESFSIDRVIEIGEYAAYPKLDGSAYNIRANIEAAYRNEITGEIRIKPFAGINNIGIFSSEMEEGGIGDANLRVGAKTYIRSLGYAGIAAADEKGRLKWEIKGYGGYVLIGGQSYYDTSLVSVEEGGYEMKTRAGSEGVEIGIGGYIEYEAAKRFNIFAQINKKYRQEGEGYLLGIGFSYELGESFKDRLSEAEEGIGYEEEGADEMIEIKERRYLAAEFKTGSFELDGKSKESIAEIAQALKRLGYSKVIINGYADATGRERANKDLSFMRARAVYEEMYKNGIELKKMRYIGFKGSRAPVANDNTDTGRARNRRVEVIAEYQ